MSNRLTFMERLSERLTALEAIIRKLEPVESFLERVELLEKNIYATKKVFTFSEACMTSGYQKVCCINLRPTRRFLTTSLAVR